MMNFLRVLTLGLVILTFSSYSFAEDSAVAETPLTKLEKATVEITKDLDENQAKQFATISNSFGIIRTVEDVQQSITRAVASCSKANPDIKEPLSNRFEVWKEAVMGKARSKMDKMIAMQGFAEASAVRDYLKKYEAAVIYRNQKIKPVPIEKLEDCQKLQTNMDSTQTNLVNLITETLSLNSDLKVKE